MPPPVPKRAGSRKPPAVPSRGNSVLEQNESVPRHHAKEQANAYAAKCQVKIPRGEAMLMPPPVPRRSPMRRVSPRIPPSVPETDQAAPDPTIKDNHTIDHSALLSRPSIRHARRPSRASRRRPTQMLSEVKASMEEAASQSPLREYREQQGESHTQDKALALIETSTVHEEQKDAGAHAFADSDLFEMVALYDLVVPLMKPCVACATFSFRSENESDLSFDKGDMVTVDAAVGADWLRGRCGRRTGIFPRTYIQWIQGQDVPEAVHPGPDGLWRALVRFDYAKRQTNDLRLVRGTEVLVERPLDELWYQGRYVGENAEVGIFPQSYVELIAPGQIKAVASLDYDSPRLSFKAGEVVELLAKISPGTKMVGRVCAQEGVFPASHVKYDKLYDHKLPIMPEDWRVSSRNVTETEEPLAFTASSEPRIFRPVLEDFEQDAAVYENLYESKLPMASKIKTRKGNRNQPQNCVIA